MAQKNELDTLIKKIGKLHKKIRFVAIIHKNGKILKTEMRDEVPSLLKTKNEEKFCKDVTVRRKMRDCLLYTSPSPRDATLSRMPSSA